MAAKTLFPNKARMLRSANALWLVLTVAPALYLAIGAQLDLGRGFGSDPSLIRVLFYILAIVSATNLGLTVFLQFREPRTQAAVYPDPVSRTFLTMATGSVLSEAHAIYGLILTLLSGSIYYGIGFSLVSWASLLWIRGRFRRNLEKLPDDQPSSTS